MSLSHRPLPWLGISYAHLVDHIVPGPRSVSYFLPFLLLPLALCIPPPVLSHRSLCALFLPAIAAAVFHAWLAIGTVDVISVEALSWSFYLLAVKDPRRDFVRLVRRGVVEQEVDGVPRDISQNSAREIQKSNVNESSTTTLPERSTVVCESVPYPSQIIPRLAWVGTLIVSLRLSDWRIGEPSHDRRQPRPPSARSHLEFFAFAVVRFFFGYLLMDAAAFLVGRDAYFTDLTIPLLSSSSGGLMTAYSGTRSFALIQACARALLTAVQAWVAVSQLYYLPIILPLALHYVGLVPTAWAPHLQPPFFGSPVAVLDRGLRGFWSIYWHQTLRFITSGPGTMLVDYLRQVFPPLSPMLAEAIHTVCVFTLSGFIHTGLVPSRPLNSTVSVNWLRTLVASFFIVQPLGLWAEKLVGVLLDRHMGGPANTLLSSRILRRGTNAAWILIWSCLCFPMISETLRQLGAFRGYPVPFSVIDWLRGGEGWMWH